MKGFTEDEVQSDKAVAFAEIGDFTQTLTLGLWGALFLVVFNFAQPLTYWT